ncbi:MAG: hypothetical protein MZW92_30150 [Comamonadaceae bacterium]|nr:hypothetical protein [Comamonadaceae bacterium]
MHLDYAQIEGMDVAAIGRDGLASVYPGPQAAAGHLGRDAGLRRQRAARRVMTLPATPLKCAGAPLKMTFLLRDRLRQAGTLERSAASTSTRRWSNVFGVPRRSTTTSSQRWQALGIAVQFTQQADAPSTSARAAPPSRPPEGERLELPYDFMHVVPPMRAPDAVQEQRPGLEGRALRRRRLAGGGQDHAAATAATRMSSASATSTARRAARPRRR